MTTRYLIFSLVSALCFSSLATTSHEQNPLLVVLLMVKNEKEVILPTLETYLPQSLKDGKPDTGEVAYIVYDTGSTDGTEVRAQEFFKNHNIKHSLVIQEPWPQPFDFAKGRNRGLAIAREKYPQSTFILFPDAEWYMHNFEDLLAFCREKHAQYEEGLEWPPACYRVKMVRTGCYYSVTSRLFLTDDDVEFDKEEDLHECLTKVTDCHTPSSVYFEIGISKSGCDKSHNRWYSDRNSLAKGLKKDPNNPRKILYLGLTEQWLGHYEIAYLYLKKRTALSIFPEEDYYALFNLAFTTDKLSRKEPTKYLWSEALEYYLQAYAMRPHRAEPLVYIARHYMDNNNPELSYVYARRAAELPLPAPEKEILPIWTDCYDFERWEILSRAAWYVGDYELGEQAAKNAIEAEPNLPYLYNTLSYYWERKTTQKGNL